ncbi:hypothetical protein [Glaciihabitans sp. UYNi722]|uniref:hypothetical protein n=1 Tax=Glaciihabitans sp. UYNi722 TaxID=3156344 RepID=UPI003394669D
MKRSIRLTLIVATACTALGVAAAAPAFAASTPAPSPTKSSTSPRSLADIQAAGASKTSQRIASLHTTIGKATANAGLTASDRSTILKTLNSDLTGMTTVATKIAADTTSAQAAADYKTIFSTYRVYAVGLPQARFAAAADSMTTTLPKLGATEKRLSALLAGKDASKSTAALQADLSDMTAQIAKAASASSGVAASVLAVTPAQYDSNHAVLSAAKQSVLTARAAVKQAHADALAVRSALKK